jgi:hypothetical protein
MRRRGSIHGRLERLEGSGGGCPEGGLSAAARRPIAVVYPDDSDKGFDGDPYASCARCGHALYTVLRVVYDPPSASPAGGG